MKIYTLLLSALLFFAFVSCRQKSDRLLLGGSGWNKVVIIDKDTKQITWEHPLEEGWECNSVVSTPEGNILFSYGKGAKLITPDHKELWNIAAPEGCEMQTARLLPDGRFLLAWCGTPAVILEVDAKGEILSRTDFDTGIEHPHAQFRQVNKNTRGNYLVPLFATSEIAEVTPAGEKVKSLQVEGNPFTIVPSANGNYWVACGDAHSYIELNYESGEVVRKVNAGDIEGARLFFVAQLYPTVQGGLYICNWQGHDGKAATGRFPQLIEVDASGQMIWNLNDNSAFGMISAVCPVN